MKRYMNAALVYAVPAMAGGVFYREFTKFVGFTGETTLSVVHTHYFMLGMALFLLLLLLEKSVSFTREEYQKLYQEIASRSPQEMVGRLGTVSDNMSLVMPALIIYKRLIEETGAEKLWIPGLNLCDGLAYDCKFHSACGRRF